MKTPRSSRVRLAPSRRRCMAGPASRVLVWLVFLFTAFLLFTAYRKGNFGPFMSGIGNEPQTGRFENRTDAEKAQLVFQEWMVAERMPLSRDMFPDGFVFGAATAAYQVEGAAKDGGRGPSIWDKFSHIPGKVDNGDTGDIACDSYNRFEEDIQLLQDMGMGYYRFSISWPRILPKGAGEVNKEGVAYYNRLIDALLKADIKPFVTLYHWDFPLALEEEYGAWLSNRSIADFVNYADVCFSSFGDRVKNWLTFNEPLTFGTLGWGVGAFAPGRCSDREKCEHGNTAEEPYKVAHNVLKAHAAAVKHYRTVYKEKQGGKIGITLDSDWSEPMTSSKADREAAQRRSEFTFGWFGDPVFRGDYPEVMKKHLGSRLPQFTAEEKANLKGSVDFIGLNHYTTRWVGNGKPPADPAKSSFYEDQWCMVSAEKNGVPIGPRAASDWLYIVPWGLHRLLMWISERYGHPDIYITENGMDDENDPEKPLEEFLHDPVRVSYYHDYLANVLRAVKEGAHVRGYFAWSLLDNFEWNKGYSRRFGLNFVDFETQKRYPKNSARWWAMLLQGTNAQAISN